MLFDLIDSILENTIGLLLACLVFIFLKIFEAVVTITTGKPPWQIIPTNDPSWEQYEAPHRAEQQELIKAEKEERERARTWLF